MIHDIMDYVKEGPIGEPKLARVIIFDRRINDQ